MRVLNYAEVICESKEELADLLKKARQPLIRRRLRFLLLLKQNKGMSQAVAGKKLGVLPRGAEEMWKLYKQHGMGKYTDYPFKGKKPKLNEAGKEWLLQKAGREQLTTLKATAHLLKEEQQTQYSLSGVHYIFKSLGIKKKTGRPSHIRKDEGSVETFKKKISPA
jgi:transposase